MLLGAIVSTAFGSCILLLNLSFTFYTNRKFPKFMQRLEKAGAPASLLIRFFLRYGLAIGPLVLGIDGFFSLDTPTLNAAGDLSYPTTINFTGWAVDLICIVSLTSYASSAGLTLLVFLPLNSRYEPYTWHNKIRDADGSWVRHTAPFQPGPLLAPPPIYPPTKASSQTQILQEAWIQEAANHPYSSLSLMRMRSRTSTSSTSGFAVTAIHPDILGYASPIDIGNWRQEVVRGDLEVVAEMAEEEMETS
ncbi:hypothetical protein T439DRAFT_357768 [Meredithblackwellia eburnea MCA 4105]